MNRGLSVLFCLIISAAVLACGPGGSGSGSSDESGSSVGNGNFGEPHDPYPQARQPKAPYPQARQPKAPYPQARQPKDPYPASGTSDSSNQNNGSTGNTCEFAFDGECDEGMSCDFGTDCSDCGNCSGGGKAPASTAPTTGGVCSTACSILSDCDFVAFSTCLTDCSFVEPMSDCILKFSGSCSQIASCFGG